MSEEQQPRSEREFEERIAANLEWHRREATHATSEETSPPNDERIETCCIWVTECYPPEMAAGGVAHTIGFETPSRLTLAATRH